MNALGDEKRESPLVKAFREYSEKYKDEFTKARRAKEGSDGSSGEASERDALGNDLAEAH